MNKGGHQTTVVTPPPMLCGKGEQVPLKYFISYKIQLYIHYIKHIKKKKFIYMDFSISFINLALGESDSDLRNP